MRRNVDLFQQNSEIADMIINNLINFFLTK